MAKRDTQPDQDAPTAKLLPDEPPLDPKAGLTAEQLQALEMQERWESLAILWNCTVEEAQARDEAAARLHVSERKCCGQ
jgi:hypothetical protein